jgi:hypothetical protein
MCRTTVDCPGKTDFGDLSTKEPEVVSLTLFREKGQRLGIRLDKNGENGGDVFISALDGRKDSLLRTETMPILVGDLLIAFNDEACYGVNLQVLKFTIAQTTGLMTFQLRKTAGAALQDKVKQAIFIAPKAHTCLPMEIDFCKDYEKALTIASMNPQNQWLTSSCLKKGQVVLGINGTPSFQLEEEDAQVFLQTKNELDPFLSIKTFTPSTISKVSSFSSMRTLKTEDRENRQSYKERMRNMLRRKGGTSTPTAVSVSPPLEDKDASAEKQQNEKIEKYIAQQNERLEEILRMAKQEVDIDTAGKLPLFASCRKLFIAMKQSINGCKKVTNGEYFFRLCQIFGTVLVEYAQILSNAPVTNNSLGNPRLRKFKTMVSSSPSITLKTDGEISLCHVIATAKYCADTVELIEELIQETIAEEYKSQVDMNEEQEGFHSVSTKAMNLLVLGLHNRLAKDSFAIMGRLPWSNWDDVEDTNDYMYTICQIIQTYMETTHDLLPPAYFRNLCDKVAVDVIDMFYTTMVSKCNKSTSSGKQQLLLDAYTLKTYFLKLLREDTGSGTKQQNTTTFSETSLVMYETLVRESFLTIESLLKISACSDATFDDLLDADIL